MRRLGTIAMTLFATRAYLDARPPVAIADGLAGHDVIAYGDELAEAPPGRFFASVATKARPVLVTSSILGAAVAAASGAGLALLPWYLAARHPAFERAASENLVDNDLWLLAHPDLESAARVRAVIDHIVTELARVPERLRGA